MDDTKTEPVGGDVPEDMVVAEEVVVGEEMVVAVEIEEVEEEVGVSHYSITSPKVCLQWSLKMSYLQSS